MGRFISIQDASPHIIPPLTWTAQATAAGVKILKVSGIALAVMTDWKAVSDMVVNHGDEAWWDATYLQTNNVFYNWSANYSWLSTAVMHFYGEENPNSLEAKEKYWELTQSGWQEMNSFFSNLFGRSPGKQELPSMTYEEVMLSSGLTLFFTNGTNRQYALIKEGGYSLTISNGYKVYRVRHNDGGYGLDWYLNGQRISWIGLFNRDVYIGVSDDSKDNYISFWGARRLDSGVWTLMSTGVPGGITIPKPAIGQPAVPFTNDIPEIERRISELEEDKPFVIEFPTIENPTGDVYQDFNTLYDTMQNWDPFANVGTGTNPGTDPGTNPNPDPQPTPTPDPGDGDQDTQLPPELQNMRLPPGIIDKFPFSIPFTLIAVFTVLNTKAEAPVFVIPFAIPMLGISENIHIDLSMFEPVMEILRWLLTLLYIFSLALITRLVIKG
jgi:hypothetical protein